MRWTAVVNPSAGRGRTRKLLPRLSTALVSTGLDVEVTISSDLEDARKLACDAFDRGRGVVACGGDGLVSELAGLAADAGGALAIVPTGAGNDFARHLGIDHRRPLDAVSVLERGRLTPVDLGRAEATGDGGDHDNVTRWFASVANTGFDSEANRWANGVQWASGTTLYVLAVVRTLAVYRPHRFRLAVDGQTFELEAWLLAVGNGHCYAGGMKITPDARADDGLLDVCVVGPVSRREFLWSFPKVFRGTHVTHPAVQMFRGREVVVESLDSSVPIELYGSGERIGPLPARLVAVPDAVRVMVPR
ncbi:MAG TPA: YegS/Rv2252/BmrU family lipid kinase [Acidimicrobiia bacterium]